MGSIHKPPVCNLALALAQAGKLKLFVETGTFQGDSLRWASQHFELVWTVEINAQYQAEAKAKVGPLPNVQFVLGNSAERLARICPALSGPALFWLDAHAGAGFFGNADDCPLLAELDACLVQARAEHCILIDDAGPSWRRPRHRSTTANGRASMRSSPSCCAGAVTTSR